MMQRLTTLIITALLALTVNIPAVRAEDINEQVSKAINTVIAKDIMWVGATGRKASIDFLAENAAAAAGKLVGQLEQNPDIESKVWILICINNFTDTSVFDPFARRLVAFIGNESFPVNFWAIRTAGKLKLTDGVRPLAGLLASESNIIRREAARALGNIGRSVPVNELVGLLKDDDATVAAAAAMALGNANAAAARDALISVLETDRLVAVRAAVNALQQITGTNMNIQDSEWQGDPSVWQAKIEAWVKAN